MIITKKIIKSRKMLKKKLNKMLSKRLSKKLTKRFNNKSIKLFGGGSIRNSTNNIMITVNYLDIGNIVSGKDYTSRKDKLSKSPEVILNANGNDKTTKDSNVRYLVIMHDPDAPNGLNSNDNHEWLHWIYIQNGIGSNKDVTVKIEEIVSYHPPSPPRGQHRYIFEVHNYDDLVRDDLVKDELVEGMNIVNRLKQLKTKNKNNALDRGDVEITSIINDLKIKDKLLGNMYYMVSNN